MSKKAKVHKIKAKVDPKPAKAGAKVTKIKASVPAKVTKTSAVTKTAKIDKATQIANVTKVKTKTKTKAKSTKRSGSILAKVFKPIILFNRYLKNSWLELKKVHWPSRKSTWAMVFAVVGYSLFFLVLVLALDNFFSYIFKLMLK